MLKENTFIKKKYNKLYVCAILGWLVGLLGGMADSLLAGIFLDSDAVAAVELVTPLLSIAFFIAMLFGMGCAIRFSQARGAFKYELSDRIVGTGMLCAVALSVILAAVMFCFKDAIIGFYGATGNILRLTEEYYTPIALVAVCYPIQWTVYYLVYYDGDEKTILLVDIFTAVSNVLFSLLMVQRMGVAGLGYGTLISCAFAVLFTALHLLRKDNTIHFTLSFLPNELLPMLKSGSALSVTTLYIGVVDIVFNKFIIVHFSENYLAAYAVINLVMGFAAVLSCAVSGGAVFTTVAYGEGNGNAVRRSMKLVNTYTLFTAVGLTVVMELLAPLWPEVYGITDPAVFEAALFAGRVIPALFIVGSFAYTYNSYYPTVGKNIEGNILVLGYSLIGPIVLAMPMGLAGGFNAMSWGFALAPVFALVLLLIYALFTKQAKALPYLLKPAAGKELHFDLELNPSAIVEVRDRIAEALRAEGVSASVVNDLQMVFEDAMMFIMNRNSKKVICDCSVTVDDEKVKLTTKDNGVIFDLVAEADKAVDLRAYVLARMQADANEAAYSVTTSFNRNVCVWER